MPMIQTAHIGVGISGQEGMQVRSGIFFSATSFSSILVFSCLEPLKIKSQLYDSALDSGPTFGVTGLLLLLLYNGIGQRIVGIPVCLKLEVKRAMKRPGEDMAGKPKLW